METKQEKIFVPLLDNNGNDSKVSEHFGHAPFFAIYDTITKEFIIQENKLDHSDTSKTPVDQVIEMANPTIVFALGIGQRARDLFTAKGISIKTANVSTLKDVIENLETLNSQTQSCDHNHEHNCEH